MSLNVPNAPPVVKNDLIEGEVAVVVIGLVILPNVALWLAFEEPSIDEQNVVVVDGQKLKALVVNCYKDRTWPKVARVTE